MMPLMPRTGSLALARMIMPPNLRTDTSMGVVIVTFFLHSALTGAREMRKP